VEKEKEIGEIRELGDRQRFLSKGVNQGKKKNNKPTCRPETLTGNGTRDDQHNNGRRKDFYRKRDQSTSQK